MRSATVFFGAFLPDEEFQNDELRREALERGVAAVMQNIEGLREIGRDQLFCSMCVEGPVYAIEELRAFIREYEIAAIDSGPDRPAVRGVRM